MAFYAHERNGPDGETVRQTVYEHLRGTARRAAECLRAAGLENAGILAGLLHDMQITKSVNGDPGEKRASACTRSRAQSTRSLRKRRAFHRRMPRL